MAALPGTAPCTTRPPPAAHRIARHVRARPPEKVVIVVSAGLALGQAANTAACIAAGLGAGLPGWAARPLRDVDGLQSFAISHLPIIILSANDAQMAALCDRLPMEPPVGGGLALFPAYAQGIHDCHAYWERHRESRIAACPWWASDWPARGAGSMD